MRSKLPWMLLLLQALAHAQGEPAETPAPGPARTPWRLQRAVGAPDWLTLRGEFLLRAEGIDNQYRASPELEGSDGLVVQRLTLFAEADLEELEFAPAAVAVELADMRQYGGAVGSAVGNGVVNTLDLLQGYVDIRLGELAGGTHRLRLGRETLDLGSRRLIARHIWRAAINAFTGVDWEWTDADGQGAFRAFWTMPVQRLPDDKDSVLDNDVELDREGLDEQLFGFLHTRQLDARTRLEDYAYVLVEDDTVSARRRLATPGLRLVRGRDVGAFDFEVEAAGQFGASRRSSASTEDLQHLAWFAHASLGYTFDAPWKPHVRLAFDYASGDRDPDDDENNRFDPLFSVQRPDFGPTEIYLALRRSNLSSPEIRVQVDPTDTFRTYAAWRPAWLASRSDAWVGAGVVDPSGRSGNFIGNQFELRLMWDVVPDQVLVEAGGALLFAGGFPQDAPNGRDVTTAFGYVQTVLRF